MFSWWNYIGDDMEMIADFFLEFLVTVFVEGFLYLCTVFVPQKKLSPKATKIITAICVIASLLLLVGLFAGIIIAVETKGHSLWGWLLVALDIVYLLVGIALKLVSYIRATYGKKK